MVLIKRGPRRDKRGLKTILLCFVLSFLVRINSLASPLRRIRSLSTIMAASDGFLGEIDPGIRCNGVENDIERRLKTDKYMYVHPSISRILVMDPHKINLDDSKLDDIDIVGDNDVILVNSSDLTVRWNTMEKFLRDGDSTTKEINGTISMEQLVTIASQCDTALFKNCNNSLLLNLPSPIRGLLRILPGESCRDSKHHNASDDDAHVLVAALLALNMVENAIRNLVGKKNGKAPLLKDMIEIMAAREGERAIPKAMVSILRTLLLPTNGLNLRNLVWHGFLPTIPRRWLSLSIILTLSLDELSGSSSFATSSSDENPKPIADMRKHPELELVLDHGKGFLESPEKLNALKRRLLQSGILPYSHSDLFEVSLKFKRYPVVFASVMAPLIEHLLRLLWCQENKQNKQIAKPGSYYVTLDGHGQRDKHDIVIMPFFGQQGDSKGSRNQLVHRLGGSTMAYLMDMFSAVGGPNIRATVAHGSFNGYLYKELVMIEEGGEESDVNVEKFVDTSYALLSVVGVLCEDGQVTAGDTGSPKASNGSGILASYQPCFSYSAVLLAEIENMVNAMESYHVLIGTGQHLTHARNAPQSQKQIGIAQNIASMSPGLGAIVNLKEKICLDFEATDSRFTNERFFKESSNNKIASECGAAKLLLAEIAEATSLSMQDLQDGISSIECEGADLSSRRRKQIARICATAELTRDFYSFAAYCALLFIERCQENSGGLEMEVQTRSNRSPTNDELFTAVKRSRMVVSTFSASKMFDRALKALAQYIAGKAVKSISSSISNSPTQ